MRLTHLWLQFFKSVSVGGVPHPCLGLVRCSLESYLFCYAENEIEEERTFLLDLIKKGKHSARKINRGRILLLANGSRVDREIAEVLHTSIPTIQRTRRRFVEGNLEYALNEQRRCGRPKKLDGEGEAVLIALAHSAPPAGRKSWTTQLLADRLVELKILGSVSDETVRRGLKKTISSLG